MRAFREHTGVVAPLNRSDLDTDQFIPKQFLKRIERTGYGEFLFYDWRYASDWKQRPEFVLNQPAYSGASILVAGKNFGCGSSREHAAWALNDYGFRVVIAPSFADIFHTNAVKTGLAPVAVPAAELARVVSAVAARNELTVDLEALEISHPDGLRI